MPRTTTVYRVTVEDYTGEPKMALSDAIECYIGPGTHVSDAAAKLASIAQEIGRPATYEFNGTPLTVNPGEDPDFAVARWNTDFEAKQKTWRESPEGVAAKERSDRELAYAHGVMADVLSLLPFKWFESHRHAMQWLAMYAPAADHIDVDAEFSRVTKVLLASGYVQNDRVGLPQDAYRDGDTMARWVAGQALECMAKGMPPHPITADFAKKALAILPR